MFGIASVKAIDWPEGFVVHEGSESPDGQYGILVPSMEAWEKDEFVAESNYLANLKTHQVIGTIGGADYFEHKNHASLQVEWSPNSKWCVATYWGRFGFESMLLLEPKDSTFDLTEIGDDVRQSLDAVMKKQAHDKEMRGDAGPYFRFGPGRKVRVRALSQNNPKQFEGVKTYYALFQGTYDLDAKKWTVTDARSITSEQNEALGVAYDNIDKQFENTSYPKPEDKAEAADQSMNSVYKAAQLILPPARFAKVKEEQKAWLKKRDAAGSVDDKCKLMIERTKALQDLVW